MKKHSFLSAMLVLVLVLGLAFSGCVSMIQGMTGANKPADDAAKTFIGQDIGVLMAVDMPIYTLSAGRAERYAFRGWVVRKAAGEEGVEKPAVTSVLGETLFVFTCNDGIIQSYEMRANQESYFGSWARTNS